MERNDSLNKILNPDDSPSFQKKGKPMGLVKTVTEEREVFDEDEPLLTDPIPLLEGKDYYSFFTKREKKLCAKMLNIKLPEGYFDKKYSVDQLLATKYPQALLDEMQSKNPEQRYPMLWTNTDTAASKCIFENCNNKAENSEICSNHLRLVEKYQNTNLSRKCSSEP